MGRDGWAQPGADVESLLDGQPDPTVRGVLRAWDPVRQQLRWQIDTSGPFEDQLAATWNGAGVMTTAGTAFEAAAPD